MVSVPAAPASQPRLAVSVDGARLSMAGLVDASTLHLFRYALDAANDCATVDLTRVREFSVEGAAELERWARDRRSPVDIIISAPVWLHLEQLDLAPLAQARVR